jgi:hypothetical protein
LARAIRARTQRATRRPDGEGHGRHAPGLSVALQIDAVAGARRRRFHQRDQHEGEVARTTAPKIRAAARRSDGVGSA